MAIKLLKKTGKLDSDDESVIRFSPPCLTFGEVRVQEIFWKKYQDLLPRPDTLSQVAPFLVPLAVLTGSAPLLVAFHALRVSGARRLVAH